MPFSNKGTLQENLVRRLTQPAPSVRSLRPEIPADLDAVVARLMAVNAPGQLVFVLRIQELRFVDLVKIRNHGENTGSRGLIEKEHVLSVSFQSALFQIADRDVSKMRAEDGISLILSRTRGLDETVALAGGATAANRILGHGSHTASGSSLGTIVLPFSLPLLIRCGRGR